MPVIKLMESHKPNLFYGIEYTFAHVALQDGCYKSNIDHSQNMLPDIFKYEEIYVGNR